MDAPAQSSGHEGKPAQPQEVPAGLTGKKLQEICYGSCGLDPAWMKDRWDRLAKAIVLYVIDSLRPAAQPTSAAKPAEDGLEAQLSEVLAAHMLLVGEEWNDCECKCGLDFPVGYDAAGKVSVYPKDSWISHISPLLIKAIRTHQAARYAENHAKVFGESAPVAAKPAEDGLEAQCHKVIWDVWNYVDEKGELEALAKGFAAFIVARERELREKLEGLGTKTQSWSRNCAAYEAQRDQLFSASEYHRGAKEAYQRVNDELRALLASHWPAQKEDAK